MEPSDSNERGAAVLGCFVQRILWSSTDPEAPARTDDQLASSGTRKEPASGTVRLVRSVEQASLGLASRVGSPRLVSGRSRTSDALAATCAAVRHGACC